MRRTGTYETLGDLKSFIPYPLPPQEPLLTLDQETLALYGQAMHRLGQLNEMVERIPDITRFIKAYVIKEALLSSEIEGIHTTLIETFTCLDKARASTKETQLVLNYTQSLSVALNLVQAQGLPIVSRVILAAHAALMQGGVGAGVSPGEYRKQQVRVGQLIPPSAPRVPGLMADLEKFINTDDATLPLIKAGLAHVQFETIHPFLDGNGRIGRLLIVLMLVNTKLLGAPLLYPSYYFKKHHREYYQRLDAVRTEGDFEGWIRYYLRAIVTASEDAWRRAKDIEALEEKITLLIQDSPLFIKSRNDALHLLKVLLQFPVLDTQEAARQMGKSYNAIKGLLKKFIDLEVVTQPAEQKRGKLFEFKAYLDLLNHDYHTDSLPV